MKGAMCRKYMLACGWALPLFSTNKNTLIRCGLSEGTLFSSEELNVVSNSHSALSMLCGEMGSKRQVSGTCEHSFTH